MPVAMSLGVDSIIIVRLWHTLISHNKIICGYSPNNYSDIDDKSKEKMVEILIFFVYGKKGVVD